MSDKRCIGAGQEPVAYITGQFAGRCVIEAINRAAVLPTGMALYSAPQPQPAALPDGWRVERRELDGSVCFIIGAPRLMGVRANTSVWESDSDPAHLLLWHMLAAAPGPADENFSTTSDRYRAELYDEVWQEARDMGYGNVTMALDDLAKLKAAPAPAGLTADDVRAACQNAVEVFAETDEAELCREVAEYMREVLLVDFARQAAPAPKTGFCGDPYVHDCGRSDCPTSDSYKKFVELATARQEVSDA